MNYFLAVFYKQMKMSSTKQKEIGFSSKHVRSCIGRNNNHNNNNSNSKMTIVILSRSKVLVVIPCKSVSDIGNIFAKKVKEGV